MQVARESRVRGSVTARTGLRRVDWVRLTRDDVGVHAEVVGVGFRLPVSRPISLSLAAELIAGGIPCISRSRVGDAVGA